MEFCWVTLRVRNLEESLKFYRDVLGLPVAGRITGNTEIAFMGEADKTRVELLQDTAGAGDCPGAGVSIGFTVDSLDRTIAYLAGKGIPVDKGPFAPSPAVRFFYVKDPDGYSVQLVENR
jgi:lactoylglutathione lyase